MSSSQQLQNSLRGLSTRDSGWKFQGEDGAALDIGTPIVHLGGGGGGGIVQVERVSDSTDHRLRYAKAGISVGAGLIPTPANFSFSLPFNQLSFGVIYKMWRAGNTLSLNEITGMFMLVELQADMGTGYGFSLMCLNPIIPVLALGAVIPSLVLNGAIISSKAVAVFGGVSQTFLPGNIGGAVSFGRLWE